MLAKLKIWLKRCHITIINRKRSVELKSGANCTINTIFGGHNKISYNVQFNGEIGFGSYIGRDSIISARIGKFTSIGRDVRIIKGRHPVSEFVSTSPSFYSTNTIANGLSFVGDTLFEEFRYADDEKKIPVYIGNDVWIGEGVRILDGISIADGAIIASNAVVTKDVPPFAIVGGVPAKLVRYRFSAEIITALLRIRWWDWTVDELRFRAKDFASIEAFIQKYDI